MHIGIFPIPQSFEAVVVPVKHRRNGIDFIREQAQIQLRIALLHHAPQKSQSVDTPGGLVDRSTITTHLLCMANGALVLGNQLRAHPKVRTAVKTRHFLRMCNSAHQKPKERAAEQLHGLNPVKNVGYTSIADWTGSGICRRRLHW
jgi:hypothetical protein